MNKLNFSRIFLLVRSQKFYVGIGLGIILLLVFWGTSMERSYNTVPSYLNWTTAPYRYYKKIQRNRKPTIPEVDFDLTRYLINDKGVSRTRLFLEDEGLGSKKTFRILVYGQSITRGLRSDRILDHFSENYPGISFLLDNKSIGGFTAEHLARTFEHDVIPFRPDLVIFHVYGGEYDGSLEEIFLSFKKRSTAEVLVLNHHFGWNKDEQELQRLREREELGSKRLFELCMKYDFALFDIRSFWSDYLESHPEVTISSLLKDDIHPNSNGNYLHESGIISVFEKNRLKENDIEQNPPMISEFIFENGHGRMDSTFTTKSAQVKQHADHITLAMGKLDFVFEGNRIELLLPNNINESEGAKINLALDDKPLENNPGTFYATRPSRTLNYFTPALKHVELIGSQIQDEFELVITKIDHNSKEIKYELYSESNGFEGSGSNKEKFTSISRRISILPDDFYIFESDNFTHKKTAKGYKIKWFVKAYQLNEAVYESNSNKSIDIFELTNERHKLSIELDEGSIPFPIRGVRVYRPETID